MRAESNQQSGTMSLRVSTVVELIKTEERGKKTKVQIICSVHIVEQNKKQKTE